MLLGLDFFIKIFYIFLPICVFKYFFMSEDATEHVELLAELQKGASGEEAERDTVLLVEADVVLRKLIRRVLSRLLPGYGFEEASSDQEAIKRLRDGLAERVALIVDANESQPEGTSRLVRNDDGTLAGWTDKDGDEDGEASDFSKVPILIGSGPDANSAAEEGRIDGITRKPDDFAPSALSSVLLEAIKKRLYVAGPDAKKGAIALFINRSKELISSCTTAISGLSFFPAEGEMVAEDSNSGLAREMMEAVEALEGYIDQLEQEGFEIEDGTLRKIVHDINNGLALFLINPAFMIKRGEGLAAGDEEALEKIKQSAFAYTREWVRPIGMACNSDSDESAWDKIRKRKVELEPDVEQRLELPKGCRVCIVDDDEQGILKPCSMLVQQAGGIAYKVQSKLDLMSLIAGILKNKDIKEIEVFLLDHELGEDMRGRDTKGHELIGLIKDCWPDALIIAHTSMADALNNDSENHYAKAGIQIVGKRDWNAISRLVRDRSEKRAAEARA